MTQPKLRVGDTFVYTEEMDRYDDICIGKRFRLLKHRVTIESIGEDSIGPFYRGNCLGDKHIFRASVVDQYHFFPTPRTLDDVKEGDVLVDKAGLRREVLGRLGQVIFVDWDEDSQDDGVINCVSYSLGMVKKHLKFADQPEERWKPEEDERFWFVNSAAKKNSSAFGKCWDHEHEIGNCFKTEAEAQKAAEELKEFWQKRNA